MSSQPDDLVQAGGGIVVIKQNLTDGIGNAEDSI